MIIQGPIAFQDVAASFTEEQWKRLENWQKEIYRTVVKEIHEAIRSLGYTIINPDVVFSVNVKKPDESFVCIDNQSVEKNTGKRDLPDILLNVKAESPGDAPHVKEKQENAAQPSTSGSAANSDSLVYITEQNTTHGQLHSSQAKKSNAFPIKTEEEAYSIDEYNSSEGDKQSCPPRGDGLIKHESEDETDTEEDFNSIVPVIVKQEESDAASGDGCIQQVEEFGNYSEDRSDEDKPSTEDSISLEIGPKKRKFCSQVHGDILSLQEREARRLRVLEGTINPFQEHPSVTYDPYKPWEVKKEKTEFRDLRRDIRNTSWCKCGHCCIMSTVEESICCHEIPGLFSQLSDERLCVTKHPAFQELCLDQDRLDFLYRFLAKIKRKNDVLYYLHKLRRTSYRAFVVWAHGFLDFRKYKPVPACVVKCIQEFLPYPEEINVGYLKMYDYPAAIMALDHI